MSSAARGVVLLPAELLEELEQVSAKLGARGITIEDLAVMLLQRGLSDARDVPGDALDPVLIGTIAGDVQRHALPDLRATVADLFGRGLSVGQVRSVLEALEDGAARDGS